MNRSSIRVLTAMAVMLAVSTTASAQLGKLIRKATNAVSDASLKVSQVEYQVNEVNRMAGKVKEASDAVTGKSSNGQEVADEPATTTQSPSATQPQQIGTDASGQKVWHFGSKQPAQTTAAPQQATAPTATATPTATARPATTSTVSTAAQQRNMDVYYDGRRVGEIRSNGDVFINGSRKGEIRSGGDVYVNGSRKGEIRSGGDIYKDGRRVGEVRSNGDVYENGRRIGEVRSGGDVYRDGRRIGNVSNMNKREWVAVVYFFGFFSF